MRPEVWQTDPLTREFQTSGSHGELILRRVDRLVDVARQVPGVARQRDLTVTPDVLVRRVEAPVFVERSRSATMKESRTTFLCVIGLVELVRPPTARFGGTGVLWVLTGNHRCDLASRVRLDQSASLTCVFGARGDAVMLDAGIVTTVPDRQHRALNNLLEPVFAHMVAVMNGHREKGFVFSSFTGDKRLHRQPIPHQYQKHPPYPHPGAALASLPA